MSFEVFAFGFEDGQRRHGGGSVFRSLMAPYVLREEPEFSFSLLGFADGDAEAYLRDSSLMLTRIGSFLAFDLLVEAAREADWVILPVGCPTCLTRESQRRHLPPELLDGAQVVTTGQDVLDVIKAA